MKRVLFVDDERRVLDGLQRMLYPLRQEWTMEFAAGGRDALARLAEADYDVLVTDVRMPEIDGIQLLSEVIRTYPRMVRIVLSGEADRDLTLRSFSLAHQYLSKPCDAQAIRGTVDKAFTLRDILDDPPLTRLIGRIKSLPSAPAIYTRLMDALGSDSVSGADIGAIIAQDLGMTAKILQLVNSPLFGCSRSIAGPEEAVIYVGIDTVRALALGESVFSRFGPGNHPGFAPEELRDHSFQVATLARRIARARNIPAPVVADIFLGGLMHDIGKLLLGSNFPKQYREVVRLFSDSRAAREKELELFGTTHSEVGAYLLWLWGLPGSVTEIVARHHLADRGGATEPAAIVQLADRIVRGEQPDSDGGTPASLGAPPLSQPGSQPCTR